LGNRIRTLDGKLIRTNSERWQKCHRFFLPKIIFLKCHFTLTPYIECVWGLLTTVNKSQTMPSFHQFFLFIFWHDLSACATMSCQKILPINPSQTLATTGFEGSQTMPTTGLLTPFGTPPNVNNAVDTDWPLCLQMVFTPFREG